MFFRKATQLLIGLNLTFIKFKIGNVKAGNFYILLFSRYNFYSLFKLMLLSAEMSVILFCIKFSKLQFGKYEPFMPYNVFIQLLFKYIF